MNPPAPLAAFRGALLHFVDDPASAGPRGYEHHVDGVLVVRDGRVAECGPAEPLLARLPAGTTVTDYRGKLILPGFVDTHVHYAQTDVIASHGEQLLTWLERYVFPAEARFADAAHAATAAGFFCDELLRNGTTTAQVLATVHPASVDALFEAAERRRMRVVAGKVLMDRNCPAALRDGDDAGEAASRALIERWHDRARLRYALTPRFAPTSSREQMALAGRLCAEYPGVHLHSHVAENQAEGAWVARLYPEARSYLDVYERYGQLGPRALFAHCIWLDDADRVRMAATGTAASFCPTSNLFLGSGLFDLAAMRAAGVRVGLGTDVGAGTSFSMLQTMNEAYKVLQLRGQSLAPEQAFYLATLGGARSLYMDDLIGSFAPGREADFVVLDPRATPLLERRMASAATLSERLFAFMMLGDDRAVAATHVLGEALHQRDAIPAAGA